MKISRTSSLPVVTSGALALVLLGGCASESQTPGTTSPASTETAGPSTPGSPSASGPSSEPAEPSATPPSDSPEAQAQTVVLDYLATIAAGDDTAAFALLSPETQEWYVDAAGFSTTRENDGSISPVDAASALDGTVTTTAGPDDGSTVVAVSSGDVADAFVVRAEGSGMVIDDPGSPLTGPTAWEWKNPPVGPDDMRQPATYVGSSSPSVLFATVVDAGGEVLVEPPQSAFGVIGGTEVPVTVAPDEGQGALATLGDPGATSGEVATIVWQPDPTSPMWRSSTVLLTE